VAFLCFPFITINHFAYILREVGRHKGTGLWHVSSPAHDAALIAKAERNPFFRARDLKAATGFLGQRTQLFQDLRQQVSGHGMLR